MSVFSQIGGPQLQTREGSASAAEARANFKELGWTALDWSAGAWWRDVDAGYSVKAGATAEVRLSDQVVQLITFSKADQFQAIDQKLRGRR